jgi:hypothetical protein
MKHRNKVVTVDGKTRFIVQRRWFGLWLTPYLAGNFVDGFYTDYRLFSYGAQYSWNETPDIRFM